MNAYGIVTQNPIPSCGVPSQQNTPLLRKKDADRLKNAHRVCREIENVCISECNSLRYSLPMMLSSLARAFLTLHPLTNISLLGSMNLVHKTLCAFGLQCRAMKQPLVPPLRTAQLRYWCTSRHVFPIVSAHCADTLDDCSAPAFRH
jgi:hypothetical protein